MTVVIHLDRRVYAEQESNLLLAAVAAGDREGHVLLRLQVFIHTGQVKGFIPKQLQ